jgi:chromosome segregation protein
MKVSHVSLCGFRGYRKPVRIEFGSRFTIIDGRNGVGKSTIFDAIEFALTGTLGKYNDAKAAGESVADYFWWTGEGPVPEDRYVEVGFAHGDGVLVLRRTQFQGPDQADLDAVLDQICDRGSAPAQPLAQLCASSIIRDEHITQLSLDLKEADRYALLRDALGANDADVWLERGAQLVSLAKKRTAAAQQEVAVANSDAANASRRLDEVRASLISEEVLGQAVARLQAFSATTVPADVLAGPVREAIAKVQSEIESLESLAKRWQEIDKARSDREALNTSLQALKADRAGALVALESLTPPPLLATYTQGVDEHAKKIVALVNLGRELGLHDGRCPLCASGRSHEEFEKGMEAAVALARQLSEAAANVADFERRKKGVEERVVAATKSVEAATQALSEAERAIQSFEQARANIGFAESSLDALLTRVAELRASLHAAQQDLRVVDTLRLSADLDKAQRGLSDANSRLSKAQERFGRARKAETGAQALHDAARRATSETLDRRLERVLPLMSELYRRLRPHPTWSDIEYSIRGDVRRFMKLQVGNQLNPQFLFSSGQRRATGLAFLLSVNLSMAWSRWRSILLDDPVQHIDDFRTVHLAEVMAHLVNEQRQVICAVEDAALADLLCRRLPVGVPGDALRITLGPDQDGALGVQEQRKLMPLVKRSLNQGPRLAAG